MLQMERPGAAFIERRTQDRLEVMLGHVDHEGVARVVAEKRRLHGRPRRVGRPLDVPDLVDAQRFGEDPIGDAVTPKRLERSSQYRSGLGIQRELRVILEQRKRQAVEV
jgi:hypothetical protein